MYEKGETTPEEHRELPGCSPYPAGGFRMPNWHGGIAVWEQWKPRMNTNAHQCTRMDPLRNYLCLLVFIRGSKRGLEMIWEVQKSCHNGDGRESTVKGFLRLSASA